MSIHTFFKSLASTFARRPLARRSPPTCHPSVEALEERWVPSFAPLVDHGLLGGYLGALVAVDLNGDGRVDLGPVGSGGYPGIYALLGNGDGTFHDGQIPGVGTYYTPIVADLNGDAIGDLVKITTYNDLRVQLGNGDGTYRETQVIVLPSQLPPGAGFYASLVPTTMTLGDLNADGKLDLVATGYDEELIDNYGATRRDQYVNVLLGNGDGTFGPSSAYYVTSNDSSYNGQFLSPVRDYDADGKPDVLTTGDAARLFSGAGDGTLQTPPSLFAGAWTTTDVNADGVLDRVDLDYQVNYVGDDPESTARYAHVGLGNGDGSFAPPVTSDLGIGYHDRILIQNGFADFDGDGLPELVTYEANSPGWPFYCICVAHNDGNWTATPPPPPPSITIGDVTVADGNTGSRAASFPVTLSVASSQPVTVAYATANGTATAGSDYQAASGTLTIPAGQTTGTITVLVNGDRQPEPNETFSIILNSPTNATIADGQGVGTILDDEPRMSINDVTVTEGNTGAVNVTFTVSLSVAYDVAVTVHYQTANGSATAGSDYAAASVGVIIAAGQTTKTFTVAVIGDRSAEPTENFVVNLSAATNGLIVDSQGVGTILDDEPRISISDVAKKEGKKNQTTSFTFTVTLSAAYDQAVTMSFHTVDGTAKTSDQDYTAKTGTLTFAPGETTKTITIEVKGDSNKEANETFYLDLFGNSSNSLFTKSRGLGTILNDD